MGVMTRRGEAGGWKLELNASVQSLASEVMAARMSPELRMRYVGSYLVSQLPVVVHR